MTVPRMEVRLMDKNREMTLRKEYPSFFEMKDREAQTAYLFGALEYAVDKYLAAPTDHNFKFLEATRKDVEDLWEF